MCNTTATRDSFTKALDDLDAIRGTPVLPAGGEPVVYVALDAIDDAEQVGMHATRQPNALQFVPLYSETLVTRLQAEVERLKEDSSMRAIRSLRADCQELQSELTKAREVITALAKGFNTLDQVCGKYSISMAFSLRDDAWDAYNKLCKFNKLSREIAPVAKDGE
jgi:hypothetical protein